VVLTGNVKVTSFYGMLELGLFTSPIERLSHSKKTYNNQYDDDRDQCKTSMISEECSFVHDRSHFSFVLRVKVKKSFSTLRCHRLERGLPQVILFCIDIKRSAAHRALATGWQVCFPEFHGAVPTGDKRRSLGGALVLFFF
jgi:hypothetical protein